MDDDAKTTKGQTTTDDLWVVEFTRRAAPRLRAVLANENEALPTMLLDGLERLRRSEKPER
jgi:hypothetical protein